MKHHFWCTVSARHDVTRRDFSRFPLQLSNAVGSSSQGVLTSFVCDTNTRQLEDVDAMVSHHCTNTALINGLDCTFDFTASILTYKTQNHDTVTCLFHWAANCRLFTMWKFQSVVSLSKNRGVNSKYIFYIGTGAGSNVNTAAGDWAEMGELGEVHDEGNERIHKRVLNKSTKCVSAQRKGEDGLWTDFTPPETCARPHAHTPTYTHTRAGINLGSPLLEYHTGSRPIRAFGRGSKGDIQRQERSASHAVSSTRHLPPVRLSQQSAHISSSGGSSRPQLLVFRGRRQAGCAMGQACGHALLCRSHPPSSEM